jgi:polyisoprenoid-binding protein YceI
MSPPGSPTPENLPMSFRFRLAPLVAVVLAASSLSAQSMHEIDKAHSEINFTADARLLTAHGYFGNWNAKVMLDSAAMEKSTVELTIDTKSINTRNDRRDGHLKSPDFFAADSFPEITFKSKSVKKTGASSLDITGDLTVRGVTKTVTIPAEVIFYEAGIGRFRGKFSLMRMEYGIKYQSKLNPIKDKVDVEFEMTVRVPKPANG